jgi:hypothetical protein
MKRWILLSGVVGLSLSVNGCGSSKTEVTGRVTTKNNKPVVFGVVSLLTADQNYYVGEIQPDGSFKIPGVPAGPVQIAVSSPNPQVASAFRSRQRDGNGGLTTPTSGRQPANPVESQKVSAEVLKGWFPLPDNVIDPKASGLSATVQKGKTIEVVIGS